ncbi:MAG TPA: RNA polymerase sigma factor [Burkholderiales bacterium]|nr:RNA polymerase sigma factor [Burkholderiales bacterium]
MSSLAAAVDAMDDVALVNRIAAQDEVALEAVMRRHNGRLFRVARAILHDDAEAEDVLQEGYLSLFHHAAQFRGDAKLTTWLTRVIANLALGRLRRSRAQGTVVPLSMDESGNLDGYGGASVTEQTVTSVKPDSPEDATLRAEIRRLVERKIDALPMLYRSVFVLREVEEMPVEEIAALLGVADTTVRTRLFRARAMLREALARELDLATLDVYGFAGARCDRIVAAVLDRIRRRSDVSPCNSPDHPTDEE